MKILILGFNNASRDFVYKVKRFPEYGENGLVSIYHIFVLRNSLSYGEDLVVEIPDPHGDGYRTYKDGFQAVDGYSTTVSSYVPWLLEEARVGSFDVIVSFMPDDTESNDLIDQLKKSLLKETKWIFFNDYLDVNDIIAGLRSDINVNATWDYVDFSNEFIEKAELLWQEAETKMKQNHIANRSKDIEKYGHPDKSSSGLGYAYLPCIPPEDLVILERLITENAYYDQDITLSKIVDQTNDCLMLEHDLLRSFFGKHHVEQIACRAFSNPFLEVESAKYVKYLSDSSTHIPEVASDFVIEFIYRGTLKVLPTRKPLFFEYGQPYEYLVFDSKDGSAGYPYRSSINAPADRIVEKGLETIIFTFKDPSGDEL